MAHNDSARLRQHDNNQPPNNARHYISLYCNLPPFLILCMSALVNFRLCQRFDELLRIPANGEMASGRRW